jgi:hypothetical protein
MPAPTVEPASLPWTLRAATAVVAVEALGEAVAIGGRSELTAGLRVMLLGFLSLKWLFAWRARHLSPGAAMGLLLLEGTTVVAAVGATDAHPLARVALAVAALTVLVLLASSLHAFPSAPLPRP